MAWAGRISQVRHTPVGQYGRKAGHAGTSADSDLVTPWASSSELLAEDRSSARRRFRRREALQAHQAGRSEEHTSELQSLMRISYAVFCLKKKNNTPPNNTKIH